MIEGKLERWDRVRHKETGGTYSILGLGKMKMGDSPDWVPSVTYVKDGPGAEEIFTRDEAKFCVNFERA